MPMVEGRTTVDTCKASNAYDCKENHGGYLKPTLNGFSSIYFNTSTSKKVTEENCSALLKCNSKSCEKQ